jgi:hypothetical protein
MDTAESASALWSAELREVPKEGWEHRKRMAMTVVMGIFGAITGSQTAPSLTDLVIVDRSSGDVIYLTPSGDLTDAPTLLQTARDELAMLTPAQFASEWGFPHN